MAILTVFAQQSLPIQLHLGAIFLVILLSPLQLWRGRRDRWHRLGGYVWISAMAVAAIVAFWINDLRHLGPFSAIHLLSIYVLVQLFLAVRDARAGRIDAHRRRLQSMSLFALVGAGAFTFAPGRTMGRMFFPDAPLAGFIGVLCAAVVIFTLVGRRGGLRLFRP